MSFFRRLFTKEREGAGRAETLTTVYEQMESWPDFQAALEAYKNPMVAMAVDSITGSILSTGFYFTGEDSEAVEAVTRWAENSGLRGLLFEVVRELVLTGNSFLKPEGSGQSLKLTRIPLTFIRPQVDVVVEGLSVKVVNYYIHIRVGQRNEFLKVPAEEVIHLAFNVLNPALPWGYGIAYQLISRQRDWQNREVPSLLDSEATLRRDLVFFLDRAVPKRFFKVNVGNEELRDKVSPELAKVLKDPGSDFISNWPIEVSEVKAPVLRFEFYDVFENMFVAALRSPVVKLYTTPGFTEASAREATGLFSTMVNAIREYLEHVLETEVFPRVVKSKVEIHWGQPEKPELRFADILQAARGDAYNPPIITREEARHMLRELGWIVEELDEVKEFTQSKIVDTLDAVHVYLVKPDDIDVSTIRYYTIDAEKGISMAVAWVKSKQTRMPSVLFFDKKLYPWNVSKVLDYYSNVFPTLLEKAKTLYV